jgi:hypothetical protein
VGPFAIEKNGPWCHATYLEMIDMNIETTPSALVKRIREFLISFA